MLHFDDGVSIKTNGPLRIISLSPSRPKGE